METIKNYFSTGKRGKTITIIVIVVALIIVGYLLIGKKVLAPGLGDITTDTTTATSTLPASVMIEVANQNPSEVVTIQKVILSQPSWIAIYNDREGEPGTIIGAEFLGAGEYLSFPVEIFARTIAGETYYAVLHDDDGVIASTTYGAYPFDYKTDLPYEKDGAWVMDSFEVLATGARG